MASTMMRKRPRAATKTPRANSESVGERYLVDARGKRIAVVLDLEEYRQLIAGVPSRKPARMSATQRAKLVALARQAKGSWKESEGHGTSVEIVRRLRDEWNRDERV